MHHYALVRRDYAAMPHLDQFALSELASESEPLGDFSQEQGARLSAEREMAERDRREGRLLGRGVRRPGALMGDDDGACPLSFTPSFPPRRPSRYAPPYRRPSSSANTQTTDC